MIKEACCICNKTLTFKRQTVYSETLCRTCLSHIMENSRWQRWDADPSSIFTYDLKDLMAYFESRCPTLYCDLMSQDSDPDMEYSILYRGDDVEEE